MIAAGPSYLAMLLLGAGLMGTGFLLALYLQQVLHEIPSPRPDLALTHGYTAAFLVAAAVLLIGAVVTAVMVNAQRRIADNPPPRRAHSCGRTEAAVLQPARFRFRFRRKRQ